VLSFSLGGVGRRLSDGAAAVAGALEGAGEAGKANAWPLAGLLISHRPGPGLLEFNIARERCQSVAAPRITMGPGRKPERCGD